jgi:hypothetical protein
MNDHETSSVERGADSCAAPCSAFWVVLALPFYWLGLLCLYQCAILTHTDEKTFGEWMERHMSPNMAICVKTVCKTDSN